MNCSHCGAPIEDLQPYFMVDGKIVCYECRREPETVVEQVKEDQ